jgi:ABC-type polysaccharide/polyol phosphate export permease
MTHVLSGVRGAFTGTSLAHLAPDAWWLAIASLLLFPLALIAFRAAVAQAQYDGSLSHT